MPATQPRPDPTSAYTRWKKSTHSGSNGGDCLEIALPTDSPTILIRDSKLNDAKLPPILEITTDEWRQTLQPLKHR